MDLKIDDLLEKVRQEWHRLFAWTLIASEHLCLQQKDGVALLDLEYVSLNVPRVLALLNK